jgi:DNA integrity scanning protein DisA with diadenylate cyclase activity
MTKFHKICGQKPNCKADALEQCIRLAVGIARDGREGRKIGTMFVIADLRIVSASADDPGSFDSIPENARKDMALPEARGET